jgi:carboxyl-terminal processing protease
MTHRGLAQRRPLFLSAIFMFLIVLLAGGAGVIVLSDSDLHQSFRLVRVAMTIDQLYQEDVDWGRLLEAGMDGMFGHLDRYSGYIEPRRLDRMHEELSGSYTGIGVSVVEHDDGLLIMSVREDGPAAASGILNGDLIIRVDSVSLRGLDVYEATNVLRGPEDTKVTLGLVRPVDDDTLEVAVTRQKIDFVHIPYAGITSDSMIYIRLLDFDAGASDDVEAALDSLLADSETSPQGVILDLRGNPGGLFSEAYKTANLFLDKGQFIVGTDGRSRWSEESHSSSGNDITYGLPLAVIVDRGSASSSEIVAGSLHQLERAILVGDTTFGKGLVQGYHGLHDGSAVRLTISRYYLADSLYLNEFDSALVDTGHGLVPDHWLRFPERDGFVRALERSLLLNRFAHEHTDEIVGESDLFDLDDSWVTRFESYAQVHDFEYSSATSDRAEKMVDLLDESEARREFRRAAGRLLQESKRVDAARFEKYEAYIKRRLKQIALERKHGTYTAYDQAIVPSREDIRVAAALLKESR